MTLKESQMSLFEESDVWMLSVEDFRARLSALLESEQDLKILEGLCSLRLLGSHLFSDLNIYSLKTSQDSSTMTTEIHSRPSSERWMNWGMMRNGKCSTARILASPRTESGCLLSDILEEQVDERYFLSEEIARKLVTYKDNQQIPLPLNTEKHKGAGRMLLKVGSRKSFSEDMATTRGVSILSTVDYTLEVIGNIYENPELMEGNND